MSDNSYSDHSKYKFDGEIVSTNKHQIDPDKIKTIDDVIAICRVMRIIVYDDGSEQFQPIRHLYKQEGEE